MERVERERRLALARSKADAAAAAQAEGRWRFASDLYATAAAIVEPLDDALWQEWTFYRAQALVALGDAREEAAPYEEALVLFRDRLLPRTPRGAAPAVWATLQAAQSNCLRGLGECSGSGEALRSAVEAQRTALEERSPDADVEGYRRSQYNLGNTLLSLWEVQTDAAHLDGAVAVFRAVLAARRDADDDLRRAVVLCRLALAHRRAAESGDPERLRDAFAASFGALLDAAESNDPADLRAAVESSIEIFLFLAERGHSDETLGYYAELFAFLDTVFAARAGAVVAEQRPLVKLVERGAGLRQSLDLGPPVLPSSLGVAKGDGSDADADPGDPGGAPRPRPAGISDEVHGEQVAIAAKLAGCAAAARSRNDFAEAALFFGAAAAAAAPVDVDLQQGYLFDRALNLYEWGSADRDDSPLLEALHVYRTQLLPLCPRRVRPAAWAAIQRGMGNALRTHGRNRNDTSILREAIDAFRSALEVVDRDAQAAEWAQIQREVGDAYRLVGDIDRGFDDEALESYRAAAEVHERDGAELDLAMTRMGMGLLFFRQAARARSASLAARAVAMLVDVHRRALRDQSSDAIATVRHHLDRARDLLADLEG